MMAKGVIVNLVALVQREEGLKRTGVGEVAIPIEFRFARGISDELAK